MSEMRPTRNELKYLLTMDQANWLKEWISPFVKKDPYTDEYGNTPVLSMYYDSPYLNFYDEKNQGVDFRNKVRLRVYDYEFRVGQPGFIEIKQRMSDQVRKLREFIPSLPENYLDPNSWSLNSKIARDSMGILLHTYNLKPSCQIFYQRTAYQGLLDADLRITFDSQLLSLYPEERLDRALLHDQTRHLISDTLCILEVKSSAELPAWILRFISKLNLNRITIPKYITGVDKLKLHNFNIAR